LNVLVKMKNNGKSDYTIKFADKALTYISKHTDLNNPEAVKQFIANLQFTTGYKRNLCLVYNKYCQYYGIQWDMPTYRQESKAIKIPTREKLEMFIARAGKTLGTKLQISMETGLRPVELHNLKVKDIDLEQRLVYPTTAKHGAGRALRISNSLQKSLQEHIIRHNLNPNDKVFKGTAEKYGKYFRMMRNQLAKKLNDPTLKTIRLYDFRHYFATTLYAKTRDILLVMKQMGHKKIQTTLIYTQLLTINDDEWTCKTAQNVEQATDLIENGFEYVTEIDGLKLFRKRK
jgi:integrase